MSKELLCHSFQRKRKRITAFPLPAYRMPSLPNYDETRMGGVVLPHFLLTERLEQGIFCIRVIHDSDLGGQVIR